MIDERAVNEFLDKVFSAPSNRPEPVTYEQREDGLYYFLDKDGGITMICGHSCFDAMKRLNEQST